MARRRRAEKRVALPDAKFESLVVNRLISAVMSDGKRSTAERIVYGAIDIVNENNHDSNPLDLLQKAIDNAKPRLEVKSRRVGGATYQVPTEVPPSSVSWPWAMRWISNVEFRTKTQGRCDEKGARFRD